MSYLDPSNETNTSGFVAVNETGRFNDALEGKTWWIMLISVMGCFCCVLMVMVLIVEMRRKRKQQAIHVGEREQRDELYRLASEASLISSEHYTAVEITGDPDSGDWDSTESDSDEEMGLDGDEEEFEENDEMDEEECVIEIELDGDDEELEEMKEDRYDVFTSPSGEEVVH